MTEMFGQLGPTVEDGRTERASPAQEENGASILRGLRSGNAIPVKNKVDKKLRFFRPNVS